MSDFKKQLMGYNVHEVDYKIDDYLKQIENLNVRLIVLLKN